MTRMPELSPTVFASKSALVVVNEHMIVQAVLPCECGIADKAHKWFYSCKVFEIQCIQYSRKI